MELRSILSRRAARLISALMAALFVLSITTVPLYHSNQNTKFLQGLADAWPERLGADWTAQTVDGLPAFSALVFAVARFADPVVFYAIEAALLATMGLALLAIARLAAPHWRSSLGFNLFAGGLFVALAHSELASALRGVAGQYMTNGYLQPSEFGILYLPALLLAHHGRSWAVLLAAVPAVFHPAYIALSAILVAVILWQRWRSGGGVPVLITLGAVAMLVLPPLDLALRFAPTDAETFARANDILAFERIPHHSDPAQWLTSEAIAKLLAGLIAIRLAPSGIFRNALIALLGLAVLGTLATAVTGSAEIALMAPWRASIVIVPVSVALLVGAAGDWLLMSVTERRWARVTVWCVALLGAIAALLGAGTKFTTFFQASQPDFIAFVEASHAPEHVYLTSVNERSFRLRAKAAQFVVWKTHPYRDVEVIEWKQRVEMARAVYGQMEHGDASVPFDCAALDRLLAAYPEVTHVVARRSLVRESAAKCAPLDPAHDGEAVAIFTVAAPAG